MGPRKKGKLSTSFFKGRIKAVNSAKKFKATRNSLKKKVKNRVNLLAFSPDNNSTPNITPKAKKRKKRNAKQKKNAGNRKFNGPDMSTEDTDSSMNESHQDLGNSLSLSKEVLAERTLPNFPSPVSVVKRAKIFPSPVSLVRQPPIPPSPLTIIKKPILPPNQFLKETLGDKFRNTHITGEMGFSIDCTATSSQDAQINDEVIVINDDDDESEKSLIEDVGEQMLEIVSEASVKACDQPVPVTPRTIIRNEKEGESDNGVNKEDGEITAGDETILLDTSGEFHDDDDDDCCIVETNDNPVSRNIQEISSRYSKAPDFIPLSKTKKAFQRPKDIKQFKQGLEKRYNYVAPKSFAEAARGRGSSVRARGSVRGRGSCEMSRGSKRPAPPPKQCKNVAEGPTIYREANTTFEEKGLRPIVIDGPNIAMLHGLHSRFSVKGIELVINYFKKRGHEKVVAFMPEHRKGADFELTDKLQKEGVLVLTPSQKLTDGSRITPYDDTFILDWAAERGAVVVTRDNYRDLADQKPGWKEVVERRILMPTFVGDDLMFPHDPQGKSGGNLDDFLKF